MALFKKVSANFAISLIISLSSGAGPIHSALIKANYQVITHLYKQFYDKVAHLIYDKRFIVAAILRRCQVAYVRGALTKGAARCYRLAYPPEGLGTASHRLEIQESETRERRCVPCSSQEGAA